jgi:transposase-like protein
MNCFARLQPIDHGTDAGFAKIGDMTAAKAFFASAKMVIGVTSDRFTTGKYDSYPRAIRTVLGTVVRHRDSPYLSNRLEQDHRGRKATTARCAGSSAHDRQANSVAPTTNCVTSSVPSPEPISKSPPTTAGSTSFAAPQRF